MKIPNDCLVVDKKEGVSEFTELTWNSRNTPKTIPLDVYERVSGKLKIVEDPHNLLSKPEVEETAPEPKKPTSEVKKSGKSKNKKR